jgi:hypothetical protein
MGENALRKASKRVGALFLIAAVAMIAIMIGIVSFLLSSSNAATQGVAKKNAEEVMQNRVENIIGRIDTLRADDEVAYEHEIDHVMETLGNASEATLLESARNDANLELTDDGTAVPFVEIDDASGSAVWRNGDVSSSAADVLDLRRASVGSYTISAFTTQGAVDDLVKGEIRKEIYASKYGQNQYVWVNEVVNYDGGDDYAIRRIHPNLSDTEGQYLSTNMEDAAGNHPYESELEGVKANGSIFQSYYFQNMSDKKIALKYSFAELYKPYNWIIATGIPLSDLYSVANEQSSQDQRLVSYVVGFAVVIVALLVGIAIVTVRRNLAIERSKEEERDLALRFENVLLGEIRRIDEPTELSTRLARLTQDLCESFGADRACILNVAGMRASEAYEWHREGAPASSPCEGEGDACAVPLGRGAREPSAHRGRRRPQDQGGPSEGARVPRGAGHPLPGHRPRHGRGEGRRASSASSTQERRPSATSGPSSSRSRTSCPTRCSGAARAPRSGRSTSWWSRGPASASSSTTSRSAESTCPARAIAPSASPTFSRASRSPSFP